MATCSTCLQEMKTADGCTATHLTWRGRSVPTFPYGRDPGWPARGWRCSDCGAHPGHHHHLGCDIQRWPGCRGQLISCNCRWDQFADEDDEDDLWDEEEEDEGAVVELAAWAPRPGHGAPATLTARAPLAQAASPLRARHRRLLVPIREAALARGRPCDLDVAAVCLEVLWPHLGPKGEALTRPEVAGLLATRLGNWPALHRTDLPEGWIVHLWCVLSALSSGQHLAPGSDPVSVLLEPLACGGGVGLDGEPLPDDADVDFACQCYVPHDPDLPDDLGRLIVGMCRRTGDPLLAVARLQPRAHDVDPSDWLPWLALTTRVDQEPQRPARLAPVFMGMAPARRRRPALWFYRPVQGPSRVTLLSLDHDGRPFVPRPDRRYREGYWWEPAMSEHLALTFAGFHEPPEPLT